MSTEYFTSQFLGYAPLTLEQCGQIRIKLTSEKGATNWLNLSPQQARDIEAIIDPNGFERPDPDDLHAVVNYDEPNDEVDALMDQCCTAIRRKRARGEA